MNENGGCVAFIDTGFTGNKHSGLGWKPREISRKEDDGRSARSFSQLAVGKSRTYPTWLKCG